MDIADVFEELVRPIASDPAWRRSIRRVRWAHRARCVGRVLQLGICQMGALAAHVPTDTAVPRTAQPRAGTH